MSTAHLAVRCSSELWAELSLPPHGWSESHGDQARRDNDSEGVAQTPLPLVTDVKKADRSGGQTGQELWNMNVESKHREVSQRLLSEIAAGKYGASGRLPGEDQLVRKFDVSRTTIGRALRDLQTEGIIESCPRTGYESAPLKT